MDTTKLALHGSLRVSFWSPLLLLLLGLFLPLFLFWKAFLFGFVTLVELLFGDSVVVAAADDDDDEMGAVFGAVEAARESFSVLVITLCLVLVGRFLLEVKPLIRAVFSSPCKRKYNAVLIPINFIFSGSCESKIKFKMMVIPSKTQFAFPPF